MAARKKYTLLLCGLMYLCILLGGSGCGSLMGQGTPPTWKASTPTANPSKVTIELDFVSPSIGQTKPVVTLTNARMTKQLYNTVYALGQMPDNMACTAERGPHYMLTFYDGEKSVVSVLAQKDGCRPVSIKGEGGDRRADQAFWSLLDKAIYEATPVARPQRLAILHTLQPDEPAQSAEITNAATVQRLYDAILKLNVVALNTLFAGCQEESYPEFRLVFHTNKESISSVISKSCNTISLDGANRSRTGVYKRDAQFDKLWEEVMSKATFAPTRPDQLVLTSPTNKVIKDVPRIQQFYEKVFRLSATQPEPNCPSNEDKVAGKGTYTSLQFTQWGLPLLSLSVYEGSCKRIDMGLTGKVVQGDAEFWDLFHQIAPNGH